MIISHKHQFIFVKTRKTAGTSVEIALSRHLGQSDIVTPIAPDDERLRSECSEVGPQHYLETSIFNYGPKDWGRLCLRGQRKSRFYNHIPASQIRRRIGAEIWDQYFKFTIERNPWDKVVSLHSHHKAIGNAEGQLSLEQFIRSGGSRAASDYDIYCVNGRNVLDFVCRYENLQSDLDRVCEIVGMPALELPRAKGNYRTDKRHYAELLSDETKAIVAQVFLREIDLLGYQCANPPTV